MKEHVTQWIPAFYDGELQGPRKEKVAAHLEACAECRNVLEKMIALSELLRENSTFQPLSTPVAFSTRVIRRLPAPAYQSRWKAGWTAAWQAIPLLLMAGWILAQTLLAAGNLSVLGGITKAFATSTIPDFPIASVLSGMLWFDQVIVFFTGSPWLAPAAQIFLWITTYVLLSLFFGTLVWGWVASWWVSQQNK